MTCIEVPKYKAVVTWQTNFFDPMSVPNINIA